MNAKTYCSVPGDAGKFLLRLTLAVGMWPHGAQKVLGWFGGAGFSGTYEAFTDKMHIWGPLALAAILTEFFAPILLVAGFLTRIAALLLAINMSVAMTYHTQYGFFMNWYGNQKGEGIEYQLIYIGSALALLLIGPGRFSVDKVVLGKFLPPQLPEGKC